MEDSEVPRPCRHFVGREEELDELHTMLEENSKVFLVKFTSGREKNPAPVFQDHRQKTVLRGSDVEIVWKE